MALTKRDLEQLEAVLREDGVAAVVDLLNKRVRHRYTGIYELKSKQLSCAVLIDKQNEATPEALAVVPLEHSFCQFVFRDQQFRTSDSREEPRLDGHVFQQVVLSYHGVPLLLQSGAFFGSLCHFDVEALPLSDDEFENLQQVAQMLTPYLTAKGV